MHRHHHAPRRGSRVLENDMATRLVMDDVPGSLQGGYDRARPEDGQGRHGSAAAGERDLDPLVTRGLRDVGGQGLAILEEALAVGADGIGGHAPGLLDRVALGDATGQRRHEHGEPAVRLRLVEDGVGEDGHGAGEYTVRGCADPRGAGQASEPCSTHPGPVVGRRGGGRVTPRPGRHSQLPQRTEWPAGHRSRSILEESTKYVTVAILKIRNPWLGLDLRLACVSFPS